MNLNQRYFIYMVIIPIVLAYFYPLVFLPGAVIAVVMYFVIYAVYEHDYRERKKRINAVLRSHGLDEIK